MFYSLLFLIPGTFEVEEAETRNEEEQLKVAGI